MGQRKNGSKAGPSKKSGGKGHGNAARRDKILDDMFRPESAIDGPTEDDHEKDKEGRQSDRVVSKILYV